jgi:hypothetical protein
MPKALRASVCLLALALFVGAVALAAGGRTRIVHFRVFTPAGKLLGGTVARDRSGSCFAGSIGLPRPDAWRCMTGNEILDPCLESPRGPARPLICVVAGGRLALRLTRPLPLGMRNRPEAGFFPWRLILANGDTCQLFTGTAAGVIQGRGLVYGCTSGGITTEPRRTGAFWTVRSLARNMNPSAVKRLSQLRLQRVAQAVG